MTDPDRYAQVLAASRACLARSGETLDQSLGRPVVEVGDWRPPTAPPRVPPARRAEARPRVLSSPRPGPSADDRLAALERRQDGLAERQRGLKRGLDQLERRQGTLDGRPTGYVSKDRANRGPDPFVAVLSQQQALLDQVGDRLLQVEASLARLLEASGDADRQ